MSTFVLRLQDATRSQEIAGVTSFVGEDASGSFGVLPGHARFMTVLVIGLARFRIGAQPWQYLAVPGAVMYLNENVLTLNTRRFLLDADYMSISDALREELLREEEKLQNLKGSLHLMEEEVFKRLWQMGRRNAG